MACKKCGSKRQIPEPQNNSLPNGVQTIELDYVPRGAPRVYHNPNTGLVRRAGGKILTIEVPVSEARYWLNLNRSGRYIFKIREVQKAPVTNYTTPLDEGPVMPQAVEQPEEIEEVEEVEEVEENLEEVKSEKKRGRPRKSSA